MLAMLIMEFVSLTIVIICCILRPSRQTPLGKYFLRQGLSAFAITFILSIVGLMIYFRSRGSPYGGITLPFIFLVPDLVACRLILQLRRRVKPSDSVMSREHSRIVRNALESRIFSRRSRFTTDVWAMESNVDS